MERIPSLGMMIRFLLLHCLILSLMIASANTSSITTDQQALVALKAHITDDPTNFLAKNWNTSSSVCNWKGVTCDVRCRRVIALNISGLSLTGTIPSQLGNLSSLQTLDLSFNWFSGSIPSSIFNMSSLVSIYFTNNTLFGELPPNFCNHLCNLESLFLTNNMFHGKILSTLSNCIQLRELSLSSNNFSGTIPIFNLSSLLILDLSLNDFTGIIPSQLGNLRSLQALHLGYNQLSGELPSNICNNLPSLKILDLDENKFDGKLPTTLSRCKHLQTLSLSINDFWGAVPKEISNFTKLQYLYLDRNRLQGSIPEEIGNFTNLKELDLSNNGLQEYGREGRTSTNGDVYSFGILLMETFTGKRPTDKMFVGEMTLKRWINDLLPISIMEVVDANLLSREDKYFTIKEQCVSFVFNLAMECTVESPKERINAKEIVARLLKIRDSLLEDVNGARNMRQSN